MEPPIHFAELDRIFWRSVGALDFKAGDLVVLTGQQPIPGEVLKIVRDVKRKFFRVQVRWEDNDEVRWHNGDKLQRASRLDYYGLDEGYHCRSCDAVLGSRPQPCPRCDGWGRSDQLADEHEAELRHHDAVYGPVYGEEFNPIPFHINDWR